jgi:hypothetical protein
LAATVVPAALVAVVKDLVGGLHERVVLRNAAAARATG